MKILDPDDYDPKDYEIGEIISFKEDNNFLKAEITDIDYENGHISIKYIDE